MGRIVDVIVDRSGQVRAAVIDFGGFLGVGSRKIAVDWNILRFGSAEKSDRVVVDLMRAQVKAAPEYKEGKQVVVFGASGLPLADPGPGTSHSQRVQIRKPFTKANQVTQRALQL